VHDNVISQGHTQYIYVNTDLLLLSRSLRCAVIILWQVCLDKVSNVVFIPCSHVCCCLECTNAL